MIDKQLLKEYACAFGIEPDDAALQKMDTYAQLLAQKNEHVNLTAISDAQEMLIKHFVDSLTVFSAVQPETGAKVLDVGTGAGFPGAVLLMARPDLCVTMLDGTRKKLDFISEALSAVGLCASTVHARAEEAGRKDVYKEQFDVVTARAVAELAVLCELCLPFAAIGGCFVAMKGQRSDEEINGAGAAIKLLGGKLEKITELKLPDGSERTLITVRKISHTPTRYPRASAQIARAALK